MCGIAAILYTTKTQASAPVGKQLVLMLEAMKHRGVDSTGVTVAGSKLNGDNLVFRLRVSEEVQPEALLEKVKTSVAQFGGTVKDMSLINRHLRLILRQRGDVRKLAESLVSFGGLELDSIGTGSEVVKDVGDAITLDRKHGISSIPGTHGIGHVRLATESKVDVAHSHPFWAFPFPDITVVHNGQLTNYRNLKRLLEEKGHRFQTQNDSEIIAVYLADKLEQGVKLSDALGHSLSDLDGSYTYVVSTQDSIGFAKDKWCFKPLVLMKRPDVVALASEEVALRKVFTEEIDRIEPQENEIMTWSIPN